LASLRTGDTVIHDLKRHPAVLLDKPYHSIHFYVPREALNALADEQRAPRIGDLDYRPGAGMVDPMIRNLGLVMHTALRRLEQASSLFVDSIQLAMAAHVAQTYGNLGPPGLAKGGLAPWQEKRAKEAFESDLNGTVALKDLARECHLSVSHFSR